MPLNQQAKELVGWGMVHPDYQGEIELPQHNRGKREASLVNTGHPLVLPSSMVDHTPQHIHTTFSAPVENHAFNSSRTANGLDP